MILVIDSEKVPDMKVKEHFHEFGQQSIEVAKTAEKARAILLKNAEEDKQKHINLIIINSELDDANGFELCRELKKTDAGKRAHIIMLVSSSGNKTAIEKARHSGADSFAVKPYSGAEFKKYFQKYMSSKVILLIEDDPVICMMVKSILARYYVEVIEVNDGIKASNLINTIMPPALVLLDIGLPNMNGMQLLAKIRKNIIWKKTPVVMMTSSTDAADVKGSLSSGANDYIVKPFKVDDFVNRLSRYLTDAG